MWPWLRPGGTLRVERCALDAMRLGDIAVWFEGRRLVAHRVVGRREQLLVTRGDWSAKDDPPVGQAELIGRASSCRWGPFSVPLDRAPVRLAGLLFQFLVRLTRRCKAGGIH